MNFGERLIAIENWKIAYVYANGEEFSGSIKYVNGFYQIVDGWYKTKVRHKKLLEMTDTLNNRSSERTTP